MSPDILTHCDCIKELGTPRPVILPSLTSRESPTGTRFVESTQPQSFPFSFGIQLSLVIPSFSFDRQALLRTYGRFFAEFLNEESLVPLGLLALSTSVGLRYDARALNLEVFLGRHFDLMSEVKTSPYASPRNSPLKIDTRICQSAIP